MKRLLIAVALLVVAGSASAETVAGTKWSFDADHEGVIAEGLYAPTGVWKVKADATAPSPPHVLAQMARNSADTCNLALIAGTVYRDVEVTVRLRAVEGTLEQGGGVAWRVKDSRNYYAARYDPLTETFRLYRVVNNGRVELANAAVMKSSGWRTIRVVATGDHILCYLDGTRYLEVRDTTFPDAGRVGLWSRADARTYFDDLTVTAR